MHYFSYGSNLNHDDLGRWCRQRGIPAINLGAGRHAFFPDRRLAFTHRSETRLGGVLDVPPALGHVACGVVFRADSAGDLAALDRKEGEGHAYRRIEAVALTPDGGEIGVVTYEVEPSHREPFVAPTPIYLDVVRRGYEAFGLDVRSLDAAARDERHPGPVTRLFVYGTLRGGEARHPILSGQGARLVGSGSVPGTLLDLGRYPGLVPKPAKIPVTGEIYDAPNLGALLAATDDIEGFLGFGAPGSIYRRAIMGATLEGGASSLVWTYVFVGGVAGAGVIASGDWRRREHIP